METGQNHIGATAPHRGPRLSRAIWPLLAAGLLLGLSGCAAFPGRPPGAPAGPVDDEVAHFDSRGRDIRVDVYRPHRSGRHPAVILLHGSSGIHAIAPGPVVRYAQMLAQQGIVSLVVHYFDATGDITASDSDETANYFLWMEVVHNAVTWARERPYVNSNKVGLLGHSLGAWLAVGAAAFDRRIDSIVLFGGGLEPFLADQVKRMPATLMFHGDKDDVVPLSDATHLADFLRTRHVPVDLCVYPGEGHTLADSAEADALARAARFLKSGAVVTKH